MLVGHNNAAKIIAQDSHKYRRNDQAKIRQSKHEPLAGLHGVVDIVIARNGTPRAAYAEDDGKVGQARAAIVDACLEVQARRGREILGRLTPQDTNQDKGDEPGISLVVMDDGIAKEGDHKGDDHNDDDPDHEGQAAARHGTQHLASDDAGDGGIANVDDNVEDTTQLGSPDAHGVASDGDLAQAGGRAKRSRKGRSRRSDDGSEDGKDDGNVDGEPK
ncbi:hypothetical protein B7463_g1912, partial [Scytalidium lignicola]